MPVDHDEIRSRISSTIEARDDLTVRGVSLAIGSDSLLHKFLSGANKSIKLETIAAIADAMDVTLSWLLFGAELGPSETVLSGRQLDAIADRALDEIQPGMSLAEIRPAVAAALRAQLELVLSGRLGHHEGEDTLPAHGEAARSAAPTKGSAPAG